MYRCEECGEVYELDHRRPSYLCPVCRYCIEIEDRFTSAGGVLRALLALLIVIACALGILYLLNGGTF